MTEQLAAPLGGPPPKEVPLTRAPLERVLAQVRFPPILAIRSPTSVGIAAFQEALKTVYPILEQEQIFSVLATAGPSPPEVRPETVWRFRDFDNAWRITLTAEFVTLEAMRYSNRKDFLARLGDLLVALGATFGPAASQRIGVRYIDRIHGAHVENIAQLVQPMVLGVQQSSIGASARSHITECLLRAEEGEIQGRWGLLPENATYEPGLLPPIGERSWVLDLDMFVARQEKFDPVALTERARTFCERIYSMFRWMTTDEFLRTFGGTP